MTQVAASSSPLTGRGRIRQYGILPDFAASKVKQKNSIGTVENLAFHFAASDPLTTQRAWMTCAGACPKPRRGVVGQD
jgi:hypothetical protein